MSKKELRIDVWSCVFGTDIKVKTIKGDVDQVVQALHEMSPVKHAQVEIRKCIEKAVFTVGVEWCCGHQIGLEVISVSKPRPAGDQA